MKQKTSVLYILRLALTLLVICAVVAGLLAGVNRLTRDRIAAAKEEKTVGAIAKVLPGGETARPIDFSDATGLVTAVYAAESGYAVQVAPKGFGGTVEMMVGVDAQGKVLAISIISHSETPNLGAVAAADSAKGQAFREQFVGYTGTYDAMSGATITSRAVASGVEAAIRCVKEGL